MHSTWPLIPCPRLVGDRARSGLLIICALWLFAAVAQAGEPQLRQARNLQKQDSTGMRWDFLNNGSVNDGTNDCFDTGLILSVDSNQFNMPRAPMETTDGSELVFKGTCGSFPVTRRISVLAGGGVRYVEVISNKGESAVQPTVTVSGQLGNSPENVVWSDGKTCSSGAVPKGCIGAALIARNGGSRPGVIFVLGESTAAAPPSFTASSNNSAFTCEWRVNVPAKGSVAIVHYCFQVNNLSAANMPTVSKAVYTRRLIDAKNLSPAIRALVVNFRLAMSDEEGPTLDTIAELLETYGLERSGLDVIISDQGGGRMSGTVAASPLAITTPSGAVLLDPDVIAAIQTGATATRIYTRSGEIFSTPSCQGLWALNSSGEVSLPFDPGRVALLLGRTMPGDGVVSASVCGFVTVADGQRLAITADPKTAVKILTPWGQQDLPLSAIKTLIRVREPRPGWVVVLADGSVVSGLPASELVSLSSVRMGQLQLSPTTILNYVQAGAKAELPEPSDSTANGEATAVNPLPFVTLRDGSRLIGLPVGDHLDLLTAGSSATIAVGVAQLVQLDRAENGELSVRLRNGSTVIGRSPDTHLTLVQEQRRWRIPMSAVVRWSGVRAPPALPSATASVVIPAKTETTPSGENEDGK